MGISELQIVKRDGKREPFSVEKIKRAISKAFLSVGGYATDDDLTSVLSRVHIADGMSVEEIQNQVEVALMAEHYFAVANSYMLYRQKHTEDREDREKLNFLIDYCDAKNPATGSKYDANANVENKNIATLIGELPKQNFIRLNRRLLTDRIREMYGKELADKYMPGWASKVAEGAVAQTTNKDGKMVAMPTITSGSEYILYNKTLLDEKGIKVPTT